MAHPVYWPGQVYLYAIGNTPAVSFTQDLPPELPANVLSLGCGDARNILYTVYADLGARMKFDFTCCDFEPAVLARNVLLYTLLVDLQKDDAQKSIQKIWNFYYHFFIDQETFDLITEQSQKLIDLSEHITTWNDSHYGKFLRFCTSHTLSELRRHWSLYVSTKSLTKAEKESLKHQFRTNNRWSESRSGINMTSMRAAGPLWMDLMSHGAKHFEHYWKTGVTFNDPAEVAKASLTNPTFAYSVMGRGFALHYGSDPILSFHLATALAPIQGAAMKNTVNVSGLVEAAVSEFRSWCLSFNERLSAHPSSLVIRFFIADALAACKALHYCAENDSIETALYMKQWTSTTINLDGGDYGKNCDQRAPLQFDVIDTSNLTDHLGLVNILITTIPLLRRAPTSVIYTNTLLSANEEGMGRDVFLQRLFGDISILSMIFDLIPVSYVSNFTTRSNTHELLSLTGDRSSTTQQFHEDIAWRVGSMANSELVASVAHTEQRLEFDPRQLAEFLFQVYLRMFSDEDMSNLLNLSVVGMSQAGLIHYLRASYAYLLRTVKSRVQTNWEQMIQQLYGRITTNRSLLVGSNNFQELFRDLHIYDLHSLDTFLPGANDALASMNGPLEGWSNVPPVVCVVFKIPRDKLKVLNDLNKKQIPTPILMCNIMGPSFHNFFQDYQSFFGDSTVTYPSGSREPSITFKEDPRGIYGSSPAIFTFYIPTWILSNDLSQVKVTLSFRSSPVVVAKLAPTLGPYLIIFSAHIMDKKYVHFTCDRPGNTGELEKIRSISPKSVSSSPVLSDAVKITLDDACTKTKILTGRANIVDKNAQAVLTQKSQVDVEQVSSQAMKVSFGSHQQFIPFPFPINSTNNKVRIARKSFYVEVDVGLSGPLEKLGMLLRPFPLVKQDEVFSLWNVHYLDLDNLPVLDLSNEAKLKFIHPHLTLAFSDREQRLNAAENKGQVKSEDLDVMTRIKQTISHLFNNVISANRRVLAFADPDNGGVYTLIFVNGIRLDLASHTIVLDSCVLPLTENLVVRFMKEIHRVTNGKMAQIKTSADEVKVLQHLLPAFTERCRKWKHTKSCEYLTKGVPVSVEMDENPLCSCGAGKDLGLFAKNKEYEVFRPYVTRTAISPLFAVPFVDTIGGLMADAIAASKEKPRKDECANCGGLGKPKLLLCSSCRQVNYCSVDCQKMHWKSHKIQCKKARK
ncbi:hypothetical protein AMATHDRAFT_75636 [Amanita thiersii Skay4041]|uniref:MYND-type domain-containing protein n=1 Tax=Amanita thiersii Skay4041 TaxID=703135 RepID=A0A2A9NRY9_9AGAR|nr:hypothetical protein AMATHDRAFT_75636 [Amanita thiersii Skay4041]